MYILVKLIKIKINMEKVSTSHTHKYFKENTKMVISIMVARLKQVESIKEAFIMA
jgi:hypothetical protein